jgi:hypothetical protein
MSRPEIPIDWEIVDQMLIAGCLGTEVAARFAMHPNTFYDRVVSKFGMSFTEFMQEKRAVGEASLKQRQYEKAMGITDKGDNTLLVWLGKVRLSQKENQDAEVISPEAKKMAEDILAQMKEMQKKD